MRGRFGITAAWYVDNCCERKQTDPKLTHVIPKFSMFPPSTNTLYMDVYLSSCVSVWGSALWCISLEVEAATPKTLTRGLPFSLLNTDSLFTHWCRIKQIKIFNHNHKNGIYRVAICERNCVCLRRLNTMSRGIRCLLCSWLSV